MLHARDEAQSSTLRVTARGRAADELRPKTRIPP
jgi:hypothetical protein